jgi:uncharacterized protein (TIGR02246 family)
MMELRELADREKIRQLLAEYTWCGDFGDVEGFASKFTVDGVLDIKGRETLSGRDAVLDAARNFFWLSPEILARRRAAAPFRHHVSSVRIQVDDPCNAQAWAYFVVLGAHGPDHWGRYTDTLTREDGCWRFALRRVSIDGASPGSTHEPSHAGAPSSERHAGTIPEGDIK